MRLKKPYFVSKERLWVGSTEASDELTCLLVFALVLLRPGSVVAQFQLLFKNILEDEKALTPLKEAVQDGNLGPLTIDAESLKIKKDVEGNRKSPQQEWPDITRSGDSLYTTDILHFFPRISFIYLLIMFFFF